MDDFLPRFGVAEAVILQELECLKSYGARILGRRQVIESRDPPEVLWSIPGAETAPSNPQVIETRRPSVEAGTPVPAA